MVNDFQLEASKCKRFQIQATNGEIVPIWSDFNGERFQEKANKNKQACIGTQTFITM